MAQLNLSRMAPIVVLVVGQTSSESCSGISENVSTLTPAFDPHLTFPQTRHLPPPGAHKAWPCFQLFFHCTVKQLFVSLATTNDHGRPQPVCRHDIRPGYTGHCTCRPSSETNWRRTYTHSKGSDPPVSCLTLTLKSAFPSLTSLLP